MEKLEISNKYESFAITKNEALLIENVISDSIYATAWDDLATKAYNFWFYENKSNSKIEVTNEQYEFILRVLIKIEI
jgi:hypothetical protein